MSDPVEPTQAVATFDDGWPADNFAGWLDNLAPGVVVTERAEMTIGDSAAIRVNLRLDDSNCRNGLGCGAYFGTNWLLDTTALKVGSEYRVWVIEQDGLAPLAAIASVSSNGDRDWFDVVDQIISTLILGEAQPHPVSVTAAGRVEHPLLGGVEIELDRPSVMLDSGLGHYQIPLTTTATGTVFFVNPFDHQGNALETVADIARYLSSGAELVELPSTKVGGLDAQVFDLERRAAEWCNSGQAR